MVLCVFQDDYEYTARLVLAPQWPTNCNPLSSAFELIHSVRTWHYSNPEVEGPVTVVDKCVEISRCSLVN